jgi:hypothetical protein
MMKPEELDQPIGSVAVARTMADHDDGSGRCQSLGEAPVETRVLRCPLATLARQVLVREVMPEMMRIIRLDNMIQRLGGLHVEVIDPGFVMLDDNEKIRWRPGDCRCVVGRVLASVRFGGGVR